MATATSLADEVRQFMVDSPDDADHTWCDDCGESVVEEYALAHGGLCPKCRRQAEADDARGAIDEAEADLEGLLEELKDVRERIAEARRAIRSARGRLARLS